MSNSNPIIDTWYDGSPVREAGPADKQIYSDMAKSYTAYSPPVGCSPEMHEDLAASVMWTAIRKKAKTNPGLQELLNKAIVYYNLLKE